jgi:hypothetical protein
MSRPLILTIVLTACAWAAGDVRVFVTNSASGYGLDLLGPQGDGTGTDPEHEDWPIDPLRPTYSTVDAGGDNSYTYDYYYSYYRVAAYPPIDAPSGTPESPILINSAAGEFGYLWFQYRNEPSDASIRGGFQMTVAGTGAPATELEITYYLQNDRNTLGRKRWDGTATPPDYPEWRNWSQVLLYVTANGLPNSSDDPSNMFDRQAWGGSGWTGVGLLGAVTGQPGDTAYEYRLTFFDYPNGVPQQGEHAFFKFVPEPPGLMLLAVAVVALRRRALAADQ